MARPQIHEKPFRTNIIIDKDLLAAAKKKAKAEGFNSFSEYLARLCVADMKNKSSSAHRVGRTLLQTA